MSTVTPETASEMFRQEPDRFLDVGEGEVAYRRVGSGPDVLFVHGWPVSGATFRKLLPHMADDVTCHVIDFPGAGSSRFGASDVLSIDQHIVTVGRVLDELGLDDVALVGHDSGGLIARYAMADDPRMRALGLINTEQPRGLSRAFKRFLASRHIPGFKSVFGWVMGNERIRRSNLVFGGAFVDSSLLNGEFDEFFLQPLNTSSERLDAAMRVLDTFEARYVTELGPVHARIDVPVQMVWGDRDPFFPLSWAREMVDTFSDAQLAVIEGAGLFSHEERPAEVAAALLPVLADAR